MVGYCLRCIDPLLFAFDLFACCCLGFVDLLFCCGFVWCVSLGLAVGALLLRGELIVELCGWLIVLGFGFGLVV